jgi:hypothetical protein
VHPTLEEIEKGMDHVRRSPSKQGTVEGLCIRPEVNERKELESCLFSPERGVEGDFWFRKCWKTLDDGRSDPEAQIAMMNTRFIDLISGSREGWKLAGDQVYVNMDISEANLSPGDRLKMGDAVLEITPLPHTGCKLFVERFGVEAMKYLSTPTGKALRLRGIYARTVVEGIVKVGDSVSKAGVPSDEG